MDLTDRLAKLLFLVREIELGRWMAEVAPSDDLARCWARRVLVRVNDLLEHCAQIQGPLKAAGHDIGDFKGSRLAVGKEYDEYYRRTRNKLSAHVQDLALLERADLWLDVDAGKLDYFVDAAREIYSQRLGPLGIAGYQPYTPFPELADDDFRPFRATPRPPLHGVEVGTDALAITRPGSIAMLNMTPVHQRAQMLALLLRWIDGTAQVLVAVSGHANARRLAVAQLVTDVVSFADCLFTRLDAGEKQEMDGLDVLVAAESKSLAAVLANTTIRDRVEQLRDLRNKITSHLDVATDDLQTLLARLDAADSKEALRLFQRMYNAFAEACREVFYLRGYAQPSQRISGVSASDAGGEKPKPFGSKMPRIRIQAKLDRTGDAKGRVGSLLRAWSAGGELAELAGSELWNLASTGPVVETVAAGPERTELRELHRVLEKKLRDGEAEDFGRLCQLIRRLSKGYPRQLAVALARGVPAEVDDQERLEAALQAALALPLRSAGPLEPLLDRCTQHSSARVRALAIATIYSYAVLPSSKSVSAEHVRRLAEKLTSWTRGEKALALAMMASGLHSSAILIGSKQYEPEILALAELLKELVPDDAGFQPELIENLVRTGDAAAVALLFGDYETDEATKTALLSAAADGMLPSNRAFHVRVQSELNRAVAEAMLGREAEAHCRVAFVWDSLSGSSPELEVCCLECAEQVGMDLGPMLAEFRRDCSPSADLRRRVEALTSVETPPTKP